VVAHGNPLVVPTIGAETNAVPSAGRLLAGHAYVGAPLRAKGKVIGVLSVIGAAGREFSAEAVTLLASIADQVGIAVENAQLYKQTEELAVAEERQRLAREIHDTLAQGFTGINIQLEAVESALETRQQAVALERLSRARNLANQSLAEARRSVWALRSVSLEKKKLSDALRDSARGLTAGTGLTLTIDAPDDLARFPLELETDLLRVAQEAVMNVVKHARAQNLDINLNCENGQIELQIKDDGRGFLVDSAKTGRRDGSGFGLIAMQERIARHGGTLQINSQPQRGTNIIAKLEFQHKGA
jgi:signal transduction histidine kinase